MYHSNHGGHSLWDEEQDNQDKYASLSKETGTDYNADKYNSGGNDLYSSNKSGDDKKKDEKEAVGIEKSVVDQTKKYEKRDASDDDIKKKAAVELSQESKPLNLAEKKKEFKSIEDAINKAVKETKEVIFIK